jgi:CRISPR-associated protein Cmr3
MSTAEWSGYRLRQEDVWFFRDGKPAVPGSDHYLRSIFPPFPSTLYGMVRTQRLLEVGAGLDGLNASKWSALPDPLPRELGPWGGFGTLRLRGPWFLLHDEILLPAPLDLRIRGEHGQEPEDDRVTLVVRLRPSDEGRESRNWSHPLAPMSPYEYDSGRWKPWTAERETKEPESSEGWLLTLEGIRQWMAGGVPSCDQFKSERRLWMNESRTGVGLDGYRRMHEEGRLFTFGFVRLRQGVSLGFELSGGSLQCGQAARFGGESRAALIEEGPCLSARLPMLDPPPAPGCVVTLLTPAVFASGALPGGLHSVRSAVVPRALPAGGWDLAKRRPKPLRRAVPAGSVYWIDKETPAPLDSWSDPDMATQGFGLVLAGHQPRRNDG